MYQQIIITLVGLMHDHAAEIHLSKSRKCNRRYNKKRCIKDKCSVEIQRCQKYREQKYRICIDAELSDEYHRDQNRTDDDHMSGYTFLVQLKNIYKKDRNKGNDKTCSYRKGQLRNIKYVIYKEKRKENKEEIHDYSHAPRRYPVNLGY